MTVKAKFECGSIMELKDSKEVKLSPVVQGSEENKSFAKFTPAGHLSLFINRGTAAFDFFEAGSQYYLNIEKAD